LSVPLGLNVLGFCYLVGRPNLYACDVLLYHMKASKWFFKESNFIS